MALERASGRLMTLAHLFWGQVWGETCVPFHSVGAAVTQHGLSPPLGWGERGGWVRKENTTCEAQHFPFFFLLGTSYLLFLVASFPKAGR